MNKQHFFTQFFTFCLICAFFLCPMAVSAKPAPRKLVLNHKELTLSVGESKSLKVISVKPKKASPKVTWKSKKPGIASVSGKGLLLAKKPGKTEIIAVSKKNSSVKKSIKITVKKSVPAVPSGESTDKNPVKAPAPKPTETSKEITSDSFKSGIHKLGGNSYALQRTMKDLYGYGKKGYQTISSKKNLKTLKTNLLKNGYKDADTLLNPYMDANFKNNSLAFIPTMLFRAYDEQITGYSIAKDHSGKRCCTVTIQYKRLKDDPDMCYATVMDEYLTILELPKTTLSSIDYFNCQTVLVSAE